MKRVKKREKTTTAKRMGCSILISCLTLLMLAGLAGCSDGTSVSVNMENTESIHNTTLGTESMVEIGGGLWYDSTTRIAYWWNGALNGTPFGENTIMKAYSTAPSPYYAPNGLPYRYNPETKTFEEIDNLCNNGCCQQNE